MTPKTMTDLRKLPEFKALEAVLAAMAPLKPEGRRRVIEALHALVEISPGRQGADAPAPKRAPAAKRRR